jgi:hypothetical protein
MEIFDDIAFFLKRAIINPANEFIYESIARGNRFVGNTIIFVGFIVAFAVNFVLIFNYFKDHEIMLIDLIRWPIMILIIGIMFFAIVVYICLIIIGISRWILNFNGEYKELKQRIQRIRENNNRAKIHESRCLNCGVKSLYTRVDGSVRCSKCGWDSRGQ